MPTQSHPHSPLGATWTSKNNNLAGAGVGEGTGMGGRERRKPEGDVGAGGVVRVFSGPAPLHPGSLAVRGPGMISTSTASQRHLG